MPPPHHAKARFLSTGIPARLAKLGLCASLVALAGCATQPRQTADAGPNHLLRDSYLLSTQADPLGAWLDEKNKLALMDFPQSSTTGASRPAPKITMASTALNFLGVKYRSGGNDPGEGFDCSGLVAYAAEKSLGLKLPRTASSQAKTGISVNRDELRRGDLVFFNTQGRRFSHVGIYLGDRKFVHAPRTGSAIRVESMDIAYWRKRYNGARRLQPDATATAAVRR